MKKKISVLVLLNILALCLVIFLLVRSCERAQESSVMDEEYSTIIVNEMLPEHGLDTQKTDGVMISPEPSRQKEPKGSKGTEKPAATEPTKGPETIPGGNTDVGVELDDAILGDWFSWSRRPDSCEFYIYRITYRHDGTCWREGGFYWAPGDQLDTQSGGYEVAQGEYTFDGTVLVVDGVKSTARISGNKLTVTHDGNGSVYTRGSYDVAIKEIIAECFDEEIVGTWYYVDDQSTPPGEYIIWEIRFSGDRKCTETCYGYYASTDTWGASGDTDTYGFFFDGEMLYSESDETEACIKDGVLQVKAPYGDAYMYLTKGDAEAAVEAIRKTLGDQVGTPPEEETPKNDPAILGRWQDASVEVETKHYFDAGYWEFYSDGTFESESREGGAWIYSEEDGLVYDDSYLGGGGQMSRGTYTFDGSTLTLTYTWIEWEDSAGLPYTVSHQIRINGDTISWGTNTLYKGERLEVAKRLLGE